MSNIDDGDFTFWSWALPGQGVSSDEYRKAYEAFQATRRGDAGTLQQYVERLRVMGH